VAYGYLWDEKREHWLVDEGAADVVRRIFAMTMEDYGPYQIAERLKAEKIQIPSVHLAHYGESVNQSEKVKAPYSWCSSTVVNILKRREYLGHTVNFKTQKHFKDKKSHYVDESEWTIFENTHEAIIDQETFDNVQRIRSNVKRYPDGWVEAALLMEGRLFAHLLDIDDTANAWLDRMMPEMAKSAGATEDLKARDQMAWVGLMNACKARVEEIILLSKFFYLPIFLRCTTFGIPKSL